MVKANFLPNDEITYIPNAHAAKNPFISREPETGALPTYEASRHLLPKPYWQGHGDVTACHDRVWQIAFSNLRMPTRGSGFVSAFIDTAFNGMLFMWDSAFILMFGRYGKRAFNFQKTLDNMYARQHKDGYICRQLREDIAGERFTRFDPCSTGPEVMAWCEWEYYKTTADRQRLTDVYYPLLAYHEWMAEHRTWRDGSYWSSGWGCGMDNQPRMQPGRNVSHSNGHMVWVDATLQAILDARCL
ncbi:MAG: glycoside hydrolase, partial [Clostridia bacterium]|nr:glycoside hydrolase [Clostridia bacterium]